MRAPGSPSLAVGHTASARGSMGRTSSRAAGVHWFEASQGVGRGGGRGPGTAVSRAWKPHINRAGSAYSRPRPA